MRSELVHIDTLFTASILEYDYAGPNLPEGGWQTIHPAILDHPVTGAPILFVNPWFTTSIPSMDEKDGAALLSVLFGHLSKPAFRYRHEWQPNDLLMWDNLSVMHAREPYDEANTRVLPKYEFRLRDHFRLPEPNGIRP